MWYSGVVTSDHDELSGFELRENICNFLRDNGEVLVSLTQDIVRTIFEALLMDGSSCEAYYREMLNIWYFVRWRWRKLHAFILLLINSSSFLQSKFLWGGEFTRRRIAAEVAEEGALFHYLFTVRFIGL